MTSSKKKDVLFVFGNDIVPESFLEDADVAEYIKKNFNSTHTTVLSLKKSKHVVCI